MGKFHNGVLGTMTGKVGGVVGRTWKGINTVASYQPNVSNPRTNSQMAQRNKLSALTALASQMNTGFIKPLWDRDSKKMSGFNAFIQANMSAINENGTLIYDNLVASRGKMIKTDVLVQDRVGDLTTLRWSTAISDSYSLASDKLFVAVVDKLSMKVYTFSAVADREEGTCNITFPLSYGAGYAIYSAFRRLDGSVTSNSSIQE